MSDSKRRGRGVPDPVPDTTGFRQEFGGHPQPMVKVGTERLAMPPRGRAINESGELDMPPEPKRWRIAISAVIFEGYAFLTWDEAMRLQDQLKELKGSVGNVFLRAEQAAQPTDYTTVEDAIASIELAVPVKT